MGNSKNTVALNGKIYDVVSGALVSKLPTFSKQPRDKKAEKQPVQSISSSKAIDGFVAPKKIFAHKHRSAQTQSSAPKARRSAGHIARHKPQHTKTLMRAMVKKPAGREKPQAKKAHGPISSVQAATSNAGSRANDRAKRAVIIKKSKHIIKFANTGSRVVKKMMPLSVKSPEAAKLSKKPQSRVNAAVAAHPHARPFIKAQSASFIKALDLDQIDHTRRHEQDKADKPKKPSGNFIGKVVPRKRSSKILLSVLTIAIAGGLLVWYFLPQVQIRIASVRAGFSASLPGYKPPGFNQEAINYKDGEVTLSYASNTDERNYTIKQAASSWNSETLLDNFVQPKQKPYQTYQEQGKTIYIYDETSATWVSGGVWYQVAGNSSLNNDQLLKIADSL